MSILTYQPPGGTVLQFGPAGWQTLSFDMEPWYEPSGTDVLGTRIAISGTFLINPYTFPMKSAFAEPFTSPAAAVPTIRMVQKGWSSPRGTLSFKVNGVEMIPTYSQVDAKNGPLPGPMRITEITNSTFLANLSIVGHFAESSGNVEGGKVLSSRWRDEVHIDRHFMSRRVRSGKVVVSSSSFKGDNAIDKLRETLITTKIDQGHIRESAEYILSESGLELGYTIVDQEQFRMPPENCSEADGEMVVTTQRTGSPGRQQMCWCTLKGPKRPESNPAILIGLATAICFQKLRLNGGFFPIKSDFREKLWKNEVTVSLTGFCKPGKAGIGRDFLSLTASLRGFGVEGKLQTAKKYADLVTTRGSAQTLLHAAAYQDPTLQLTLDNTNQITVGGGGGSPIGLVPGG